MFGAACPRKGRKLETTLTNQRGLASKYLRIYRLQAGLTQAQLAAQLGVSVTSIARWESGKYAVPMVLIYLADMTADDLADFGIEDEATA